MHDWDNMPSRVSVSVFNDSDIDGVVSFETREMMSSGGINMRRQGSGVEKVSTRNFLIKAGTGKQIAVVMKGMSSCLIQIYRIIFRRISLCRVCWVDQKLRIRRSL